LPIVPVLLLANIFLGIYYNLTVWYKLSDKTIYGVWITLIGSAISVLVNYIFIPRYGLMACAWATFICYGTMMVTSYLWGQKFYRIPYAWKKLLAYMVIVVIIFFIHTGFTHFIPNIYFDFALGIILIALYGWFLTVVEHKEFSKLPVIGKYFQLKKNTT
jgi:O-antigen/teichoic acid export membrane protein